MDQPSTRDQRRKDTLRRLAEDVDVWVATADGGVPYLVPLSFHWDGAALYLSTLATNPTARNLAANGRVRLTLPVLPRRAAAHPGVAGGQRDRGAGPHA